MEVCHPLVLHTTRSHVQCEGQCQAKSANEAVLLLVQHIPSRTSAQNLQSNWRTMLLNGAVLLLDFCLQGFREGSLSRVLLV